MWVSKNISLRRLPARRGFSLPEVMAALMILAFVSTSVVVVINRCINAAADATLRMRAFEVARDNMEKLLAAEQVTEMTEYGASEIYPEIEWETAVEAFYEPVTSRMWIQAVCSAEYVDTEGEIQTVEMTHWLTNLTKQQVLRLMEETEEEKRKLAEAEQLVETTEEAADYLGVDVETIEAWAADGMPRTKDGSYIKLYLDVYDEYDGYPPPEALQEAADEYALMTGKLPSFGVGGAFAGGPSSTSGGTGTASVPGPGGPQAPGRPGTGPGSASAPSGTQGRSVPTPSPGGGPFGGYTLEQLEQLPPDIAWQAMMDYWNQNK
ncbi:MAG: prepilin-type N-terminal cleavage/methylation domain-containing protein [Planctomycetota bacterium]|jgi:prepilin-type N-terminal cleavage/methylation domain-containing protein/excisionase family DNA binding protein